jgi:hypothetical protein
VTRREFDQMSWPQVVRTILKEAREASAKGPIAATEYLDDVGRIIDDAVEDAQVLADTDRVPL